MKLDLYIDNKDKRYLQVYKNMRINYTAIFI